MTRLLHLPTLLLRHARVLWSVNADQPRVPAGSSEGGQFASGDNAGGNSGGGTTGSREASTPKSLGEAAKTWRENPAEFRKSLEASVESVTGRKSDPLSDSGKVTEVHMLPGLAQGQANLTTGELTITKYTAEEADRFSKGDRDEAAIRGMHVMVHEQTHLSGPMKESARTMQNQTIEEMTTEIVARKAMAAEFGIKGKIIPAGNSHRFGAYQHVINATVNEMAKQDGITAKQAAERVEKAAVAFRGRKESFTEYRPALDAFMHDLGYGSATNRTGLAVLQAGHDAFHGRKPRKG